MHIATTMLQDGTSTAPGRRQTIDLPVVNLADATFECTFGRGCEGICCREGRPPVYPDEIDHIAANLHRFLPHMRPEARAVAERDGFMTPRLRRLGERVLRVVKEWCIFFNQGCVLHQVGAAEGDKNRYKPCVCALFPIQMNKEGQWYVRQEGVENERWDLFCLAPGNSTVPARESLRDELALAQRFHEEAAMKPGGTSPLS